MTSRETIEATVLEKMLAGGLWRRRLLARKLGYSRKDVSRALDKFARQGLVETTKPGGRVWRCARAAGGRRKRTTS